MSLSATIHIAVSGMQAADRRLGNVANNLANVETDGYQRRVTATSDLRPGGVATATRSSSGPAEPQGSNVDIATEMLDMIGAETAFAANAKVFETGADMWDMLLSIKRD